MTLCIGGPLHGRQAPLSFEDMPHFRAPIPQPLPTLDVLMGAVAVTTDCPSVLYVKRPIDIFVGGTSVPAYVYAVESLNGREIAARIAAVLGNAGRHG